MNYIAVKADGEILASSDSATAIDELISVVDPTATRVAVDELFEGQGSYRGGVITRATEPEEVTIEDRLTAIEARLTALEG